MEEENDAALAAALAASEAEAAAAGITIRDPHDSGASTSTGGGGGSGGGSPDRATGPPVDPAHTVARLSSPWSTDDTFSSCAGCSVPFGPLNRRHHCRLCGRIFCGRCTSHKSLIPPSSIVLVPKGGHGWKGKVVRSEDKERARGRPTFAEVEDPDREITYLRSPSDRGEEGAGAGGGGDGGAGGGAAESEASASTSGAGAASAAASASAASASTSGASGRGGGVPADTLLYGRGLEERAKLAREPLRVCDACHSQLAGVQERLRLSNANAMRYNAVDPTDVRRLFNSPLAFTLGHEVRKAAYTLNNLLPLPKRMGAFVSSAPDSYDPTLSGAYSIGANPHAQAMENCKDTCQSLSSNFGELDGVRIPARLLERAKGVAVLTVVKGGLGFAGFEFGTGLVVARLPDGRGWSPPSAVGLAGVAWGALVGAQVTDHVFLLMTDKAVELMCADDASFQLGADVAIAVGPLGRTVEADLGAAGKAGPSSDSDHHGGGGGGVAVSPIYTYSLSKGLYAGASLDGKVVVTRHNVNERFYGYRVRARDLLGGEVPTPPAAQPLYDALRRCHVYATSGAAGGTGGIAGICGGEGENEGLGEEGWGSGFGGAAGGFGGGGGGFGGGFGGHGGGGGSNPLRTLPPGARTDDAGFGGPFAGSSLEPMGGGSGVAGNGAAGNGAQDGTFAPPEETRFGGGAR